MRYLAEIAGRSVRGIPIYLYLLNLNPGSYRAFEILADSLAKAPDPVGDILALLAPENWRPHLPALVWILVLPELPSAASILWRRFDEGTWVAPQVAAVLSVVDPDFEINAARRIKSLCAKPIMLSPPRQVSDLPFQVPRSIGPEFPAGRAKPLTALVGLLRAAGADLADLLLDPAVRDLQRSDLDRGDRLATLWRDRVQQHLGRWRNA
ncbi:MAG: hypothetical protein DHS20C21_19660 [Gemmatimonadota bacterium]|nr:MAG: hypothetical protein DHS20C21_19660 [Gemmatimonadota bacterium]